MLGKPRAELEQIEGYTSAIGTDIYLSNQRASTGYWPFRIKGPGDLSGVDAEASSPGP
jgi:hypothetical protein